MRIETITKRDDLVIRRHVLETGEAMPWHTDSCHRFSVVVRGDRLKTEFLEAGEPLALAVHPGLTNWDEPDTRVHRAVNTGSTTLEEVITFFLPAPSADPQPVQPYGGPRLPRQAR